MNDHLLLIVGKSATGKSASLRALTNPERTMYLNTEAGKKLPFPSKFKWDKTVTDPMQVFEAFDVAETLPDCDTIIVDSLTFLLDMYESKYVKGAVDGRAAWGNFAEFFKSLMQEKVAKSTKTVIFTAHTSDKYNESEMLMETSVPVKGSLKNNGIEAYFTTVIATKKVKIADLDETSPLLTITDKERRLGFKYVFQTDITASTINERIRGPMAMWEENEVYIDNNVQLVIDRFKKYYGQ
ncbi:Sak4-like ssDNA annealing protein [Pseudomonas phage Littlefix]|uniref:AAA domain protein n=1 Tax=Pseudomonas phage Littlefix TaxID=2079289 RepID=A0A2K9VHN6_9CAUD|nr:Sak4-like ssDNA annealing protein [Pseudomonas phage Littlefix]AUV61817.1 hypothetical protein PsPhLittlefix_gp02 [Pseudomonas phage Littlefix]